MDPCTHCGACTATSQHCGACHIALYCNRACQRAHWPLHKAFCSPPPLSDVDAIFDVLSQPGEHTILLQRLHTEAAAHLPDSLLVLGHWWTSGPSLALNSSPGLAFLREAHLLGHPAAPYLLGRLNEGDSQGDPSLLALAQQLYLSGYGASKHLGCALQLYSLSLHRLAGSEPLTTSFSRLHVLALLPTLTQLAALTGTASLLPRVLTTVTDALGAACTACTAAGRGAEAAAFQELHEDVLLACLRTGVPHLQLEFAHSILRPHRGASYAHSPELGQMATYICRQLLAVVPAPAPVLQSRAHSLLGCAAVRQGDLALARECYASALGCCREQEIDKWALHSFATLLLAGPCEGGDRELAMTCLSRGCQRELESCLQLAVQLAQLAGQAAGAASLQKRAAAALAKETSFGDTAWALVAQGSAQIAQGLKLMGV